MKNFLGSLGQRSREGNLLVEMCSHEFFLKHGLSFNLAMYFFPGDPFQSRYKREKLEKMLNSLPYTSSQMSGSTTEGHKNSEGGLDFGRDRA